LRCPYTISRTNRVNDFVQSGVNSFAEEEGKLSPIGIPIVNDERYDASGAMTILPKSKRAGSKKATHSKTSRRKSTSIRKCFAKPSTAGTLSAERTKTQTTNARRRR
jgi:hypothetical protein